MKKTIKHKRFIEELDTKIRKVFLTVVEKEMIKEGLKQKGSPYIRIIKKIEEQEKLWGKLDTLDKLFKHREKLEQLRGRGGIKILAEDIERAEDLNEFGIIYLSSFPKIITDYKKEINRNEKNNKNKL